MDPQVERGTYEIIRDRLLAQAEKLLDQTEQLNRRRLEIFGGAEMSVAGNLRIRTENNCVPRDIVAVGELLLFGYNVFIGLRTETQVQDVFSLHAFERGTDGSEFSLQPVAADDPRNFLNDEGFLSDFTELYRYYKNSRLLQLRNTGPRLLAVFQTGESPLDIRAFRWSISAQGQVEYIDNRGERDHAFPPSHDFEWTPADREDFVLGRHPHVSILDEVFVETVGGDLTVKVENNTEDGLGIYREAVEDPDQSLDDAEYAYARLGVLILLRIRPYREDDRRYLVFNTRTQQVDRIDAIGESCIQLPEDHGIIFPGGYYLQSGETKIFAAQAEGMEFTRMIRSPNGEDVLYLFHKRDEGRSVLLNYNMIRKEVDTPIHCHGFSRFPDGVMVIFRAESDEPTRVHPMQIWRTSFADDEYAARAPSSGTLLEKIGNADLVRGVSDSFSLIRSLREQSASRGVYEDLIASAQRMLDTYYWLDQEELGRPGTLIRDILSTAETIIDEFEKVEEVRGQTQQALQEAEADLLDFFRKLRPQSWSDIDEFVQSLGGLQQRRGHLITLGEMRYADRDRLGQLERQIEERYDQLSQATVDFLQQDRSLEPYRERISRLSTEAEKTESTVEAAPIVQELEDARRGLDLLTEVTTGLKIDDPLVRTAILEDISEVLASLNRGRALLEARRKELIGREGVAEFAAQFRLINHNLSGALTLADSPEKCDELLSRILVQLEDLESRFSEFDEFLEQLTVKREEVMEAFSARKRLLLDQRQQRAGRLMEAAERILSGLQRRADQKEGEDELNAFFSSDPMSLKLREIADRLRELNDDVKADEILMRLKAARQDAGRSLRDRRDLFEDGRKVIRLGRHRFSVNTQRLELTLIPREDRLQFHLMGTDFFEDVEDPTLEESRPLWKQLLVSESDQVYRGEYLAAELLAQAEGQENGLSMARLRELAAVETDLQDWVRQQAGQRYDEAYERGVHDVDAGRILAGLVSLYSSSGLLRFAQGVRSQGLLYWIFSPDDEPKRRLLRRARSLGRLRESFSHSAAIQPLARDLSRIANEFLQQQGLEVSEEDPAIGQYLFEELRRDPIRLTLSAEADSLARDFHKHLAESGALREFEEDLRTLKGDLGQRYQLARAWLMAFRKPDESHQQSKTPSQPPWEEAAVRLVAGDRVDFEVSARSASTVIEELLGRHRRIEGRRMPLQLDEFLSRLQRFRRIRVPQFHRFQQARHRILERRRQSLRLPELMPRVMSAFVRNRLIDQVYLPLVGDNLSKQIGALGQEKRTDQMGLLLLVSPPGYGKTTLMEYVAHRLGLVFVKINGPALGHSVRSLDPSEAPNATSRQEVEKINLAFEMANNVLLYIDDIQHTHSEFLQKFISLCDAQRRVEGVWKGRTRTYNMQSKRFCICMAGNPYTESGERFRVPDMLANRADIYNLGDVLKGKEEAFALSYLENALTSNPILAPLTTRAQDDIYKLVRMAQGEEIPADQLEYGYSAAEIGDILSVLRKLISIRSVLHKVNQAYIHSASQKDEFRSEPPFQLQGSYRNINKLAEKVLPVMNDDELEALIDDHYRAEAQTLTSGAEANRLKLAELRGRLDEKQQRRWEDIKRSFRRIQALGGQDDDPVTRVVGQISSVSERLHDLGRILEQAAEKEGAGVPSDSEWGPALERIAQSLTQPAEPSFSKEVLERLGGLAEDFSGRLEALSKGMLKSRATPSDSATPLGPYLEKLDQTLREIAQRGHSGGQIVQVLPSGAYEILDEMSQRIDDVLMRLARSMARSLEGSSAQKDRRLRSQLDKTLKEFDLLKDYLNTLKKIDVRSLGQSPAKS